MGWFVTVGGRNFLYYIGLVKKVHLGFSIRAHGKIQTNFLMRVKEESEKVDLMVSIQKTKIMASGPITSWQINGKQWKQ